MTTTSAPFREADILRDTAGKFSGKDQSAPELTLGDDGFDLASFMQEPPTVAEPFTAFQPVVYTDIDGTEITATVLSLEGNGFARIVERTPGTQGDIDDETRVVEERYLTEDLDVSRDFVQRQNRALTAATERTIELTKKPKSALAGLESYDNALRARDQLEVDGRTDWLASQIHSVNAMDVAAEELVHGDHLALPIVEWVSLDGGAHAPETFAKAYDAIGWEGTVHASAALKAKLAEQYTDITDVDERHITRVNASIEDALDLGSRMNAAVHATDSIEGDADTIGDERAAAIFPEVVTTGLTQRKKLAYRKAVGAVSEAFEVLDRHDLLDSKHRSFARDNDHSGGEAAILIRAAGQAAVLRHYQPETGLTDKQLDAISSVWDTAVAVSSKAAA